jgi:hypothetical protein
LLKSATTAAEFLFLIGRTGKIGFPTETNPAGKEKRRIKKKRKIKKQNTVTKTTTTTTTTLTTTTTKTTQTKILQA